MWGSVKTSDALSARGRGAAPVGAVTVGQQQKAGEVAFVGLDALLENLQPVAFGGHPAADGGVTLQMAGGDLGGAARRVVALDGFELRVRLEEFAALHQGDGVGVDLVQVVGPLPGQRRQHVRDAQLALADDLQLAAAQQLVVLQQTAGDRVLDGDHAQQRPSCRIRSNCASNVRQGTIPIGSSPKQRRAASSWKHPGSP